jgi:hypothetical protein
MAAHPGKTTRISTHGVRWIDWLGPSVLCVWIAGCSNGEQSSGATPNTPGANSPTPDGSTAAGRDSTAPGAPPSDDGASTGSGEDASPEPEGAAPAPAPEAGAGPPCMPTGGSISSGGPLAIDTLQCDVTAHEVDSFLSVLSAAPVPTSQYPGGSHNYLADGTGGTTLEAINRVCEIAGDIPSLSAEHVKLLDLAIHWSDTWLTHRNDLPLGDKRVMWTGKVDPIWPPDAAPDTYAGCEVGETVGILAYTALNIANSPDLWSQTVPDGDPNKYGATYEARMKTYVTMLEFSMDNFFNNNFLNQTTLTIQHPNNAAYNALSSNNVNAWNREMMFLHAWQTLAQVHKVLGDDAGKQAMYESVTRNTVNVFVRNAAPKTAPDGTPVYDWGYGNYGDWTGSLAGEDVIIHGQYDIWGLTRAYRAGYTDATPQQMKTYADTVVHEMMISPGVYAGTIDRCCSTATYHYLPAGYMYLAPYTTGLFVPAATADIQSGPQKNSPAVTASILWAKHVLKMP